MKIIVIQLALLFGALSGSALAAEPADAAGQTGWLLAKYDLNGDARITQEEISEKKLDIFRMMDANGSGGVSYDEYEKVDSARRNLLLKARFNKLDHDKNGEVTEAEYSSFLGQFSSIDANGDGALTSEEIAPASSVDNTHCFYWFCLRFDAED